MACKAIFAIFALCVMASPLASAMALERQSNVTEPATNSSSGQQIQLVVSIVLKISTPDIQAAIAEIQKHEAELRQYIQAALAKVDNKTTDLLQKADEFLENLQKEIEAAGDKIAQDVSTKVTDAITKIRAFLKEQRQKLVDLIAQAQQQLNQTAEQIKEDVARVTEYLKNVLQQLSQKINNTIFGIPSLVKNRVNKAITNVRNIIDSPEVQEAIKNALDGLKGGVTSLTNVLQAVAAELLAAGEYLIAGLISTLTAVLALVGFLLSALPSLDLSIHLG